MMKEVKRVLKPDGILILSSPDKTNYSDVRGYNNPFHIKELTRLELQELVGRYFSHTEYIAQRAGYFSVALSEKRVTRMNSYKGD
jgi:SAM-dependent methyltransferase